MKFIKLNVYNFNTEVLINFDHITRFYAEVDYTVLYVHNEKEPVYVLETPEEIRRLLKGEIRV